MNTPIQTFQIGQHKVFVKREDLYATPPAPPMAKTRGIERLLKRLANQGITRVGAFEAPSSQVGLAVTAAAQTFPQLSVMVAYPVTSKRQYTRSARQAELLGAQLIPVPSNVVNVCYGQAKRIVEARGGYMIPFGFEFPEAVDAVADQAATVNPRYYHNGTILVCAGSGVTVSGILNGISGHPQKIVCVSSGRSAAKIGLCIRRNARQPIDRIEIHEAQHKYTEKLSFNAPFPCDPYYDLKAWKHLIENIENLPKPILFWNVGG